MNMKSIGIEMCVNYGGKKFRKTVKRTVAIVQDLMAKHGIPIDKVITHHDASWGKDCPAWLRDGSQGIDWQQFIDMVQGNDDIHHVENDMTLTDLIDTPTLTDKGDQGGKVKKIQQKLITLGYDLSKFGADGMFGEETVKAVKQFQKDHGLAVDGIVGPKTKQALQQAEPKKSNNIDIATDGKWGSSTTKAVQIALNCDYTDGVFSGQYHNEVTDALYGGINFGGGGSPSVEALQQKVNSGVDGLLGPSTISNLQQYLGTPVDGVISRPTSMVVKELQQQLNEGNF